MRASQFFIGTFKEAPVDTEIISHRLMVRAGMIQRVAGGVYNYLPIGLRSIRKVEKIIREEMEQIRSIEILMPALQPVELWQKSGRLEKYGSELIHIRDRHQRDFVLGSTHEEVITDIIRRIIKSYRQLPINLFQIQTKFRDEIRPRFGVMRSKEFIMKDAYSFDRDMAGLQNSYTAMREAYVRIFKRLKLVFRMVSADSGPIGGFDSHEFHAVSENGEDVIVYCPNSDYAANLEVAEAVDLKKVRALPLQPLVRVKIPYSTKCDAVAACLEIKLDQIIKSIPVIIDPIEESDQSAQIILLLLRGDHTLNDIKVSRIIGPLYRWRFASEIEVMDHFGVLSGYIGPISVPETVRVIADRTAAMMSDFGCGGNENNYHFKGVNWGRDLPEPEVADLRNVVEGDPSPDGNGSLLFCRGIEVGHIFQLGTKYSKEMEASYIDENGRLQFIHMGCYGIGINRILGALIEQNYDAYGIIWPESVAPFEVVICPINWAHGQVRLHAISLYDGFRTAGVDVILDDRGGRPGTMFADWELIGIPHRVVVSERGLKENKMEYQGRKDRKLITFAIDTILHNVIAKIRGAA